LIYPPENSILAGRIVENGAVVTEFPPGTRPEARNFPARNRLISGMSLGVVVTEAPEDSGALITARYAGEQGRDVFAVPGNIYSRSSLGALALIQDGAKLVMGVTDILGELNLQMLPQTAATPKVPSEHTDTRDNTVEGRLLALLGAGEAGQHIDDLCHTSGIPIETVSAALAVLELKGLVKLVGPMTYIACVPYQDR
jgi:DNA processing protein